MFQTPDTLDDLFKQPQIPSEDICHKLAQLELEEKEPQVLSCKWVDGNAITLGVYYSWSKNPKLEPKTADQRGDQEGSEETDQAQIISKV